MRQPRRSPGAKGVSSPSGEPFSRGESSTHNNTPSAPVLVGTFAASDGGALRPDPPQCVKEVRSGKIHPHERGGFSLGVRYRRHSHDNADSSGRRDRHSRGKISRGISARLWSRPKHGRSVHIGAVATANDVSKLPPEMPKSGPSRSPKHCSSLPRPAAEKREAVRHVRKVHGRPNLHRQLCEYWRP